jgi:uncharacterized repeat protein (TIGR03803 family)
MAQTKGRRLMRLAFAIVTTGMAAARAQPFSETVLHNFGCPPRGEYPVAGVIRDAAGNLYGTAEGGGTFDQGVVFKVDPAGRETVLYSFTGGADGADPQSGVILDSAGNLYGTTLYGGTANQGVVYMVSAAGQETVLYSFTGGDDGGEPFAGLIRDAQGNLYGTTYSGGKHVIDGVVFKLDAGGHETVLHSFTGDDGAGPSGTLIRDPEGNFYGTTQGGGPAGIFAGSGVVFKLDPAGHLTVLYAFTGGQDGGVPWAGVVRDPAGNLYGTTSGVGLADQGAVFKLDPAGHETTLHTFTGGADGGHPRAGVILDSSLNLYGTATNGGTSGNGVVYRVDPSGEESVLYNFTGASDGSEPFAGVIRDPSGDLYGTTFLGGSTIGVVYRLNTAGQESVLYTFPGGNDGFYPAASLIRDEAGNLYGATEGGSTTNAGTVYRLDSEGKQKVLYRFTGGNDGAYPTARLVSDSAGNLYGTAQSGGAGNMGVVYKLDPTGQQTVLYSFTGADGNLPLGGVVFDSAGNLYGTTNLGGSTNAGVVFKLSASGQETVLYSFTGGDDGGNPVSGVTLDSNGNIYGTTKLGGRAKAGVAYRLSATGQEAVLHTFTGGADGGNPVSGLLPDSTGNLYGTTYAGGAGFGYGVVYKLDTAGHESVLYSFTGAADGGRPVAGVIRDSAGNLYGTTSGGGSSNCENFGCGVVYRLNSTGQQTVLYSFSGVDGGVPYAGVILDSAGSLYGATANGGTGNAGVVFRLDPQ